MKNKIIDYIERLEAKSLQVDDYFKQRNDLYIENQKLQQKIDKAIKYIKKCMKTTYKINDYWTNELVNGVKILEILGDKENE